MPLIYLPWWVAAGGQLGTGQAQQAQKLKKRECEDENWNLLENRC